MILCVENLTKKYGKKLALDQFSYTFHPGIYGLLGPNGAGKSTLMGVLTTILRPTSGRVLLDGTDIRLLGKKYRKEIGYMPQQRILYEDFSLERFLHYIAAIKGVDKETADAEIEEIIRYVNLESVRDDKISTYSGGMKQRALLAQTILGNPGIVIMDEPTVGLDPKERVHFREIVSRIAEEKIVIIATHIVSDLEKLASEVIFLNQGKIVQSGTLQELTSMYGSACRSIEDIYMKLGMGNE